RELEGLERLRDRGGGGRSPPPRTVLVEGLEVGAHRPALGPALGERTLVLGGHRALASCGHSEPLLSGLSANPISEFDATPFRGRGPPIPWPHGAAPPSARDDRRRGGDGRRLARARSPRPRAGHVRRDVVGALLLQVVTGPSAAVPDPGAVGAGGAGRGSRRRRRRRRAGRRAPDRESQPPVGGRAVPG